MYIEEIFFLIEEMSETRMFLNFLSLKIVFVLPRSNNCYVATVTTYTFLQNFIKINFARTAEVAIVYTKRKRRAYLYKVSSTGQRY
jgi:hypothetical protein